MRKLKSGDEVQVLQGKDKGKKGKIERVLSKKDKVLVSGVNMYKRHVKRQGSTPPGIIDLVKPLPSSKLALVCPKCKLVTKIGFILKNGKKSRVCKKCKQEI